MVAKMLGYKPVFCKIDPDTFNSGPEHIEAKITDKTGAVVATHLFGQPCPIREIIDVVRKRNIRVLEDCAHACGVRVDGRQVGTFGDIGVFSFAEGKNMPCFGGGAIATRDETIAERARSILSMAPMPEKKTDLGKGIFGLDQMAADPAFDFRSDSLPGVAFEAPLGSAADGFCRGR